MGNWQDDAEKIANDIGYPVMLKSVYGGGGRGIRIVNSDKELREGYESVTGESKKVLKSGDTEKIMRKHVNNMKKVMLVELLLHWEVLFKW